MTLTFSALLPNGWKKERLTMELFTATRRAIPSGECIRRLRVLTSLFTSEDTVNHIEFQVTWLEVILK